LAIKVDVRFEPILARAAVGQLTIQSNSSTNAKAVIDLSGTGESVQHEVILSWKAPSSSTTPLVVGYHIYRLTGNSYAYQLLSALVTQETYVDSAVLAGITYDYYVTSVDSAGVESVPSNEAVATIP
jgi:fibronectin type 3 domain-containing protein